MINDWHQAEMEAYRERERERRETQERCEAPYDPSPPTAGTAASADASGSQTHPAAGGFSYSRIHPTCSVRVTPAIDQGRPAYVGQSLLYIDGEVYGGVLCTVSQGSIEASNELAHRIAGAWNATGHLRHHKQQEQA